MFCLKLFRIPFWALAQVRYAADGRLRLLFFNAMSYAPSLRIELALDGSILCLLEYRSPSQENPDFHISDWRFDP